jgi:pyochelin biosynthesis protein PchG
VSAAEADRPRVVVCGTTFGQFYLAALADPDFPCELSGILAGGSKRSRACAERYGVPLFTDPNEVPEKVDIACVVVRGGSLGGVGTELAQTLMARGIHVLHEHPLHHDEIAASLRVARSHGVHYRVNGFYVHLDPVRQFLAACRELRRCQPPLYIDAACSIQVAYAMLDILCQALGTTWPSGFAESPRASDLLTGLTKLEAPFQTLEGVVAGVPLTLRVQNQLDPRDPDNHVHLLHRITLGAEGGNLTLLNTHGPLLWSPRLHVPQAAKENFDLGDPTARATLLPASATQLGRPEAPTFREILESLWPAGIQRAILGLRRAILGGEDQLAQGQYQLALSKLWQNLTTRLGYPRPLSGGAPQLLPVDCLSAAVAAVGDRQAPAWNGEDRDEKAPVWNSEASDEKASA